jgi:hypothetical protein
MGPEAELSVDLISEKEILSEIEKGKHYEAYLERQKTVTANPDYLSEIDEMLVAIREI